MAVRPIVGAFELCDAIGEGGMSRVYRGVHQTARAAVAIKLVTADAARRRRCREALANEVRAMARLDHSGIVRVLDYGMISPEAAEDSQNLLVAGSPYLVMELAPGGTLQVGEIRDWDHLRGILHQLLTALAHAHARGVIHRDIKPSNILVADDGIKLSDFGIAHALSYAADKIAAPLSAGTSAFMAPEQILGLHHEEGPATDLYALGCLSYLLCCGRLPFRGARDDVLRAHCLEEVPPLRPRISVPSELESWIRVLMAKRPEHRFELAADARHALEHLGGEMLPPVPAGPSENPTTSSTHVPTKALAGIEAELEREDEDATRATTAGGSERELHESVTQEPWEQARLELVQEHAERSVPGWGDLERRLWATSPRVVAELSEPPVARHDLSGIGLGVYGLRPIPIAGRDREKKTLWQLLCAVAEDEQPRAAVMVGRAGLGKTRLTEWLVERAVEHGAATALWAGHAEGSSEDVLRKMLLRYLHAEGLSAGGVMERLRVGVGGHDLSPEHREQLQSWLTPETTAHAMRREERFALVRRFLSYAAKRRPVVIVFDDVQYGEESIAFADYLLRRGGTSSLPIMMVLTARQEALEERAAEASALSQLTRRDDAIDIGLAPLAPEEHSTLVEDLLGLEPKLAQHVAERTDGSPLFAVQLVGDWVQRGYFEPGASGFRLRDGVEPAIPDDIHALWSGRIDRLLEVVPPEARVHAETCLELAAALGRRVRFDEWHQALVFAGSEVPELLLDAMANRRLALVGRRRFTLVHGLLLESLERRSREAGRWQPINLACAQMVEGRYGDTQPERMARHLLEGHSWSRALEPLLRGAEARQRRSEYDEATVLASRYFGALEELGVSGDDPRVASGWLMLAETEALRGRVEQCKAALDHASKLIDEGSETTSRSHLWRLRGGMAHKRGHAKEALGHYEKSGALAERGGLVQFTALALHGQAEVLKLLGRLDDAEARYLHAGTLFDKTGDKLGIVRVRIGLADVHRRRENLDEAFEMLEDSRQLTRRMGNRYSEGVALNSLGDIAREKGRLADAEAFYREGLAALAELDSEETDIVRLNLGLVLLARERFELAMETVLAALPGFERVGRMGFKVYAHAFLIAAASGMNDWDEFDTYYLEVRDRLEKSGLVDNDLATSLELAGERAAQAGMRERARRAYELALKQWEALALEARSEAVRAALEAL